MNNKFLRFTFLAILCFSIAGKALINDNCQFSEMTKAKSVASYHSDDSSSKTDIADCNCHCHHHHFDFAVLSQALKFLNKVADKSSFDTNLALISQIHLQKRPPKLVS